MSSTPAHSLVQAQEARLARREQICQQTAAGVFTVRLGHSEYQAVLALIPAAGASLDAIRQSWLDAHGPRLHLTWWLRLVLSNLCARSRVSIHFIDNRPIWSRI